MASIQKRRNTYFVVYRVEGKQRWKRGGNRKKDALALKVEVERQLQQGTYREMPDISFKEFAYRWLSAKKSDVRPKTLAGYRTHLKNKIIPYFSHRKLKSITTEDIEAFKAHLAESGSMSPATVGKYLLTIKMVLKTALIWGYVGRNVAEFVKKPRAVKSRADFLTSGELKQLIEATDERYKALIATAAFTGLRQGELLALRWGDIDFVGRRIFVQRTLQQGKFYEPKSPHSRRAVDIPSFLVEMLKVHQARLAVELSSNEYNLVFPNEEGKPLDRANLQMRVFEPALKRAGLRHVRFHDLRHSYASLLINSGASIKYTQKQLGHASCQITLDTYSHLIREAGQEAIDKLDSMVEAPNENEQVASGF